MEIVETAGGRRSRDSSWSLLVETACVIVVVGKDNWSSSLIDDTAG